MGRIKASLVILAISTTYSPACFADDFKAMAKNLAYAARDAEIERVAVLPFSAVGIGSNSDGRIISENLTTRMVSLGKVQVIERFLLKKIMSEHLLDETGAVAPSPMEKLGEILSADGIVTGTFYYTDKDVFINARLINAETGAIVAASQYKVRKKWLAAPFLDGPNSDDDSSQAFLPQLTVAAPAAAAPALEDSSDIRNAPDDPDLLESMIKFAIADTSPADLATTAATP